MMDTVMTFGIDLGTTRDGTTARLDLEELLATRLLVQGNSGSGKSHLLRRMLEQSANWVQQAIIDPEGEFVTLAESYNHLIIQAEGRSEAWLQRTAERVRQHRASVVLSLEGLDTDIQMRAAAAFLGGLFDADRDHWFPMLVVVDEAQLFAPAAAGEVSDEARRASLGAMTNLMARGRKRGLAGVIATQRLAKLAKNVAAEASNFLMGRTFLDIDMARAADLLGLERRQAEMFRDLQRGQFISLGPALSRRPVQIQIGSVQTGARAAPPALTPLPPVAAEDVRDLVLSGPEPEARPLPPRRPTSPPPLDVAEQLARFQPSQNTLPLPLTEQEQGERDRKVRDILRDILDDPEAGFRPLSVLYQDFLVRCRIHAITGDAPALPQFRAMLATARAGIDAETEAGGPWQSAVERSLMLPDDMRGVFLMLARAALETLPCPSDEEIARAYGTRSLGRARRLLGYMEEKNLLVMRHDRSGLRILTMVELGWETAPAAA
ncbi:putative ATP-binding protein [Granulibacter bethesdensis CGDNIH4]|nr:putative ATP-binding protein [Granulibacter bethesdensis CGDNIH4]